MVASDTPAHNFFRRRVCSRTTVGTTRVGSHPGRPATVSGNPVFCPSTRPNEWRTEFWLTNTVRVNFPLASFSCTGLRISLSTVKVTRSSSMPAKSGRNSARAAENDRRTSSRPHRLRIDFTVNSLSRQLPFSTSLLPVPKFLPHMVFFICGPVKSANAGGSTSG